MINRLMPAGINIMFCAKEKVAPGEISRVKKDEEGQQDKLVRSPKFDTFTASSNVEEQSDTEKKEHLSQVNNHKKSSIFTKKGNA